MMDKELFERGLKIRKEVMGADYVERSLDNATDYERGFQEEFITGFGWGAIWGREGLTRQQRSILNLGMLAGMGRFHEFRGHLRGALNNGLTREEIRELLIQIAGYCGMPTGLECFRAAKEVFAEIDKDA